MKDFLTMRPSLTSLFVFVLIFIGGSISGFILGLWAMSGPCESPCDGGAMAASFIWSLSFTASFILGVISAGVTWLVLRKSRDKSFN